MNSRTAFGLTVISLLLVSCLAQDRVASPSASGDQSSSVARAATVILLEGEVESRLGGDWKPLETGALVSESAEVRTGKNAYVDLGFGEFGTLHLGEKTVVALGNLHLAQARNTVDVDLVSGRVIATVRKLVGTERFRVSTNTVAAGVRGTRFLVSKSEEGSTTVAVQEGFVVLLPPALDPPGLEKSSTDPVRLGVIQNALEQVALLAPVVRAGEESTVTEASMAASQNAAKDLQTGLANGSIGDEEALKSHVETYQRSINNAQKPDSRPMGDASRKAFESNQKPTTELTPTGDPLPGAAFGPPPTTASAPLSAPDWLSNPSQSAWLMLDKDRNGSGLGMVSSTEEGTLTLGYVGGRSAWIADGINKANAEWTSYLYFSISDPRFTRGASPRAVLTIEYWDEVDLGRSATVVLEYDSQGRHPRPGIPAAFEAGSTELKVGRTRSWKTFSWTLDDAEFGGKANNNDFRLVVTPGFRLALASLAVSPAP